MIFNRNFIVGPLQLNAKFSVLLYFSSIIIYDAFRRSFTWNFNAMVCCFPFSRIGVDVFLQLYVSFLLRMSFEIVLPLNSKFLFHYPAKSGILQSPSCVCLFVCLLAGFLINYWSDFDEIW